MHYFLTIIINLAILINTLPMLSATDGEGRRIVGGVYASIEEFPYQVSIEKMGKHICGGSLIEPNIVLTAAHCLISKSGEYSVRAGTAVKQTGGQVAKVVGDCNHPNYNEEDTHYDYDVNVLKLDHSFTLNSNVQLIDLQPLGEKVPVGEIGTVTGWGRLNFKGEAPTVLHKVDLPKASDELCENNEKIYEITDRMTCYGFEDGGKDSCQMDSGGPLIVNKTQVGIVSWGYNCAVPDFPGVYTRIEDKDIRSHIDKCLADFN